MSRHLVVPAAVALVVAAAGLAGLRARDSRVWETRAVHALALADTATSRADSLEAVASAANTRAEEMAELAAQRGRLAQQRVVEIRERAVPDTCLSYTTPRDEVIDTLLVSVDRWGAAWGEGVAARVALTSANLSLRLVADSMSAVLRDRPGGRSAWVPTVGLGLFTGLCVGGDPCAGVGVTLSWSIR